MSLEPGRKLAHYEIVEPIGKGGMGEVFRAKDTKLGREVAIKILPEAFAENEERLRRFQREAKVLASLNHPNIAAIYGLEEFESTHYLVLELVEGETLAQRISRRPLPPNEARELASKIAEALEEAHERGIVHRDLKPANVKITLDDKLKVLDFGLAKAFAEEAPEADGSMSPTITRDATHIGVILGTAAYMSPEQAKGKRIDKRTDIFAFGAVLYEMLAGKKAFPGDDVSEVLAAVLKLEPDWSALPPGLDPHILRLLRRCLEKDPRKRRRDIGDVLNELVEPPLDLPPSRSFGWRWPVLAFVLGALLAGSVVAFVGRAGTPRPAGVIRASLLRPGDAPFTEGVGRRLLAVSSDGSRVAYSGEGRLFLKELDATAAVLIPGSRGAPTSEPVFSPEGKWVAFLDGETVLKKISVHGGTAVTICEVSDLTGISWSSDSILFAQEGGVFRVSDDGGDPELLIEVDAEAGQAAQGPRLLPDGRTVLFALGPSNAWDEADVLIQDLRSGERRRLIEGGADADYLPTGHLVYMNGTTLFAVPFNLERLEVTGGPVPVVEDIPRTTRGGAGQYALSRNGVMVYASALGNERTLAWVDREGFVEPIESPRRRYTYPRLSPKGGKVAVLFGGDVWVHDLLQGSWVRLTFTGDNDYLVWSPGAKRVIFSSTRDGPANLYWVPADGSSEAEALLEAGVIRHPDSVSRDSNRLSYHEHHPENGTDLWWLSLAGDREPKTFLSTAFNERFGALSPDGRWLAYISDESGRYDPEVYVRSFPEPTSKHPISNGGGGAPSWSRDGRELFYVTPEYELMVVAVTTDPSFRAATAVPLFSEGAAGVDLSGGGNFPAFYDVSSDGKRFLTFQTHAEATPQINLIVNWFEELERLVPLPD